MEKIKKYLSKFRPNWRGALPVVLFFGAAFLIVAVFFGLQFVMTASAICSVSWSSAKPLPFSP